MEKVIKLLEERRWQIVDNLKSGNKEYLSELQEIDKAIGWLKKVNVLNLSNIQRYDVIELPFLNTGWSEYRIINDCETDNINDWIELKIDNNFVRLTAGDLIIQKNRK